MLRDDDHSFRVRIGRLSARDRQPTQPSFPFARQVMRSAAKQAGGLQRTRSGTTQGRRKVDGSQGKAGASTRRANGRFNARGRGRKAAAVLPRTIAWSAPENGMRFRARRVVVKARVVPMRGAVSRAGEAHLRYLERDGVSREGEEPRVYSTIENEADGKAFIARGREDRHQFRLIVSPEDAADMGDLRDFTRRLMAQMEQDLETQLDWVAIDHHNTGHPHTHVMLRGVTDDGKILNIAGDYIAHGIRARASELVTLELGPQSEWEVQQKLRLEVGEERLTRLDRMLLREANEEGLVDLGPAALKSYVARTNRTALWDRLKKLERLGLATPMEESGRWSLSPRLEQTLKTLGKRTEIASSIHSALARQGIERPADAFTIHRDDVEAPIAGRLIGKGLAHDELADRAHLVIDGADGRTHYVELTDVPDDLHRGSIIEVGPAPIGGGAADRTIAAIARENGGVYRPSRHLAQAIETVRVPHDDHAGYVEAHVRRLEALWRAGIVERLDADRWLIPDDFEQRTAGYDAKRSPQTTVRVLSAFDLERQVTSDGATWLDRQLLGRERIEAALTGFGREVTSALARRQESLVERGHATQDDASVRYRPNLLATLERQERTRIGEHLARSRDVPFRAAEDGERVRGTFKQTLQLASGKYALIENALEFTLVPWRPIIERRRGQEISGIMHGTSVSWELGRKRGLGL
jgi:type IV secretory pathway VirD2 relaxase